MAKQSKEARYNQRVQAAYESIRAMGHRHENDLHELFSVASQSAPGMRYQVTRDLTNYRMHCTCLAGVNERATCVHRVAVTRWVAEREVQRERERRQSERETRSQEVADRARQARITAAYRSLRETANRDGQPSHRAFSVASQSDPTVHYTVTWDTDTDALHCTCTAGSYGRDCVHQAAMRRYIAAIHAADARRTDEAQQARQAAADRARDTSILRRDNRPFSILR
jgi:uncharacterized Zn finger protein